MSKTTSCEGPVSSTARAHTEHQEMGKGTLQSSSPLAWLITSCPVYWALKPQLVVMLPKVPASEQQGWAQLGHLLEV